MPISLLQGDAILEAGCKLVGTWTSLYSFVTLHIRIAVFAHYGIVEIL